MSQPHGDYLGLDDAALISQCDVQAYRSSGPGGQHRNKVSSAIRLHHKPTDITVHADETRSQHQNKSAAVRRLRMMIACRIRNRLDLGGEIPTVLSQCLFHPRPEGQAGRRRLQIGRKDARFWQVAGGLLDLLEAFEGRLADAAGYLNISTSNLISVLQQDRHLLAAAQDIRKRHGHRPIS